MPSNDLPIWPPWHPGSAGFIAEQKRPLGLRDAEHLSKKLGAKSARNKWSQKRRHDGTRRQGRESMTFQDDSPARFAAAALHFLDFATLTSE